MIIKIFLIFYLAISFSLFFISPFNLVTDNEGDERGGLETDLDPLLNIDFLIAKLADDALHEGLGLLEGSAKSDGDGHHLLHEGLELVLGEGAALVLVERLEEVAELGLGVALGEDGEADAELLEGDGPVPIRVEELEEGLDLLGGGALHVGLEEVVELFGVELTAVVGVELLELGVELVDLLVGEVGLLKDLLCVLALALALAAFAAHFIDVVVDLKNAFVYI